jgi:hypothetical protein
MPGSVLNIDYPTDGESFVSTLAKLTAAIATIVADLEPRISAGVLDIDTELSMGGAPLTNVAAVRLTVVTPDPTTPGSIYYGDDELHFITSAGDIQVTANGGLNIASLGTIGGDYGSGNPAAVNYVNAGGYYTFETDPGVWADVYVKDVVLKGDLGSVRLSVDSSLAGDEDITFKTFPAALGMFAYNPADGTMTDAVGQTVALGGATFASDIDVGTNKVKHGEYIRKFDLDIANVVQSNAITVQISGASGVSQSVGGFNDTTYRIPPLLAKERLKSLHIRASNNVATNTMSLYSVGPTGAWTVVPLVGGNAQSPTGSVYTLTPVTPTADQLYVFKFFTNIGTTILYNGDIIADVV